MDEIAKRCDVQSRCFIVYLLMRKFRDYDIPANPAIEAHEIVCMYISC